jgi:hypothetical protein
MSNDPRNAITRQDIRKPVINDPRTAITRQDIRIPNRTKTITGLGALGNAPRIDENEFSGRYIIVNKD